MKTKSRFPTTVASAFHAAKIVGVRAGTEPHRFLGVWVVVVNGRVFVRPWNNKPGGWYRAFREEPEGAIQLDGRELPVRARKARGERLMDALDQAYREKYPTPESRRYVRGFARPSRRAATLELLPA